jgi:hypothetical protein
MTIQQLLANVTTLLPPDCDEGVAAILQWRGGGFPFFL